MDTIDIFYGKRLIRLTEEIQPFYAQYKNREHLKKLIDEFQKGNYYELYICHNDLNELFQNFKIFFKYIESAGGVVINQWGQILMIKRVDNLWQFPKGKKEPNENYEEAALREVKEETGLDNLTIIRHLPSSYYIFKRKGIAYLKHIKWFKMLYRGYREPVALKEEGIVEVKWFERDEVIRLLQKSYSNLQVLLSYI